MSKELDEFYKSYSARITEIDDTPLVKVMDGGRFKLLSIEEYEEITNKLSDLESKLAEKEKELEIIKNLKSKEVGKALSCVIEKLTDVIGQNLDTTTTILDFFQKQDQDKISFAVEQLEKLLSKSVVLEGMFLEGKHYLNQRKFNVVDKSKIEEQIKDLKEKQNER